MSYTFPAVRGIQAGREYYILMCPLRVLNRICFWDQTGIESKVRTQRLVNKGRIPQIAEYILQNPSEYCLSSLTISVDADIEFVPVLENPEFYNMGSVRIPKTARFIINDGQHRWNALRSALMEKPELGSETISIVLFIDTGLRRAQQLFADLNRYAVRPSQSLNILFDHRDELAALTKQLIQSVHVFYELTEIDKSTVPVRSSKLFTLSALYRATKELLEEFRGVHMLDQYKIAEDFWNEVAMNMSEWRMVQSGKMSAWDVRRDYVHTNSIALIALGRVGRSLLALYPRDWVKYLSRLQTIDWNKDNVKSWEGRILVGGKVSSSRNNIVLMTSLIKQHLGIPLLAEELVAESAFELSMSKTEEEYG